MNGQEILDSKRSSPELRGYVKKRIEKMQATMARKGVDVVIMTRPENVFYFSNFNLRHQHKVANFIR